MEEMDQTPNQEAETTTARRSRRWRRNAGRYFWDFIVIVAGIAVSFAVSGWISHSKDKKTLKGHMAAIRLELVENLEIVENLDKYFDTTYELSMYLLTKEPEQHDWDSVLEASFYKERITVFYHNPTMTYSSSAYETLKASGMMNTVRDQEQFRELVKCYKLLEEIKYETDEYFRRKLDAFYTCVMEQNIYLLSTTDMLDPVWSIFYYFMASPYEIPGIPESRRQIEKVIGML